jgi:heme A synthase
MDDHHRLDREDNITLALLTLEVLLGIATVITWATIGHQAAAGLLLLVVALAVVLVIRTWRYT